MASHNQPSISLHAIEFERVVETTIVSFSIHGLNYEGLPLHATLIVSSQEQTTDDTIAQARSDLLQTLETLADELR